MVSRSIAWVLATTLGLALGGFVFHFPGSYGESGFSVAAAGFGMMIGGVNGLIAGALMALVSGAPRAQARAMVLTMGGSVGFTHAIFDGSSTALPFAAYAILGGILVAAVFAWSLGMRAPHVIATIGLGWSVGLIAANQVGSWLGLPWEETPVGWAMDHAVDGIVVGLVWAIATAAVGLPGTLRARLEAEPPTGPGSGSAAW